MRQIPFTTGLAALILAMAAAWREPAEPAAPFVASAGAQVIVCTLAAPAWEIGTVSLLKPRSDGEVFAPGRAQAVGEHLFLEVPHDFGIAADGTVLFDGGRTSGRVTVGYGAARCVGDVRLERSARIDFVAPGGAGPVRVCDQELQVGQIATLWLPPSRLTVGCTISTMGQHLRLGPEHDGRTFWIGPVAGPPRPRPDDDSLVRRLLGFEPVSTVGVQVYNDDGWLLVEPGGPAARAGLRTGDTARRIDAGPVPTNYRELLRLLRGGEPGSTLVFDVVRIRADGQLEDLTFTVERAPLKP